MPGVLGVGDGGGREEWVKILLGDVRSVVSVTAALSTTTCPLPRPAPSPQLGQLLAELIVEYQTQDEP